MDVLDEFRRVRPDAARFDQRDADRLWDRTFGSDGVADADSGEPSPEVAWLHPVEAVLSLDRTSVDRHRDRRVLVWLGSAAAVIALVVAVSVAGRPAAPETAVSEPGSTTAADDPVGETPAVMADWTAFPTLPIEPRFQYSAVSTPTGVFVWGGCCVDGSSSEMFNDGAYFDGATQTWAVLPDAPLDPTRGDAVAAWNGSEVVVVNGVDGVTAAAFDPASFTWRSITPPSAETATNGGSRLHLFGDGRLAFVHRMSVSYWDSAADTWSSPIRDGSFDIDWEDSETSAVVATYATTPTSIAAVTIGSGDDCSTARIRTFDSATDTWSATALPSPASFATDIVGIDAGRFLLTGAYSCDPTSPPPAERAATIFDPANNTFTSVTAVTNVEVSSRYGGIWNGDVAMWLLENGRVLAYRPAADEWLLGPALLDASANSGDLISDTPLIWFDNQLIVVSPGWGRTGSQATNPGGWSCCFPTRESWSTTVPTTPATTAIPTASDPVPAEPSPNGTSAVDTIDSGTVLVANAAAVAGLAGRISLSLQEDGFTVAPVANANATANPERTVVYARRGHEDLAATVADLLGLGTWEPMPTTLPVADAEIEPEDIAVLVVAGTDIVDRIEATTPTADNNSVVTQSPAACTDPGRCDNYIVQSGDYPVGVAEKLCITMTELLAANQWSSAAEFPAPDTNILIPPAMGRQTCPDPTG